MTRIVVAIDGEVTTRAAQSLSAHPDVQVALLSPTTSSQFDTVDSPDGFDAVLGTTKAAQAAAAAGLPVITTGELRDQPGVAWASITGLALALATELHEGTVAVAVPGEEVGDETVVFPSPIDVRRATVEPVEENKVYIARGDAPLAAALALGRRLHRVIVDDFRFMEAVALAAGVGILMQGPLASPTPVWQRPSAYLQAAADMGLVIGERTPEGR
ncbi:MAG TPA: hypothetical protein VHL52_09415 [Acidimicrobiia bacterium]|nr:hypothetical protein [Acidimicrobiia bacterium]